MPMIDKAVSLATDRMPKVISPRLHAAIDYANVASFAAIAALLWKKDKRASVAAMVCGGAIATNALLTDFPGGVAKVMSFEQHGAVDVGLAPLVASLPTMMNFDDKPHAKLFTIKAVMLAAVTGLTDFRGSGRAGQLERVRRAA